METYLKSFQLFNDTEIQGFAQLATPILLKKGQYFIQEGSVCQRVAFVETGFLRHFILSENGDETTYCFSFPNQIMTAYSSFITHKPTQENIQALTDVTLWVVYKEALEKEFQGNANWLLFGKMMAEREYVHFENRIFSLLKDSAKQRYIQLLNHNSDYIQHLPLQYLASYLGITQRHLSRLRREVVF